MLLNFFKISQDYKIKTKQFTNLDLNLSLILYGSMLLIYYLLGKILSGPGMRTDKFYFYLSGMVAVIIILIVIFLCKVRKQSLSTVGLSTKGIKKSFILGVILSLLVILIFGVIALIKGITPNDNLPLLISQFFYYLIFIAFVEELVFRGYIGTRIYGHLKNKFLAITINGILFVLMHLPFQVVYQNMTIVDYLIKNWGNLIFVFILHYFKQFLYAKYNNIVAPTLFHFTWNYIQWIF